jgi:hypothetical protein
LRWCRFLFYHWVRVRVHICQSKLLF